MNEFEKVKALLITLYGKSEEDVKALISKKGQDGNVLEELSDNWMEAIKTLDAEKSSSLTAQIAAAKTTKFQEGHNTGFKKRAEDVEAAITSTFGKVEGETVEEKIAALKALIAAKKPEDFNAKESADYKALQLSIEAQLETQKAEYEAKLIAEKRLRESLATEVSLLPLLTQKFKQLNVVNTASTLPNQLELILNVIKSKNVSFKDGIVYNGEEILLDKHSLPMKQDNYLNKIITSYFPTTKQQDGGGGGGQGGNGGGGGGGSTNYDFSGADGLKKYAKVINDPNLKPEERLLAKKAYEASRV